MDLIFFLLNLALVLLEAFVILSSSSSIWDFKLSFSASKFLNFLTSLEPLFHLHLSCLLVRVGCLVSVCGSHSGSQVDICRCLCGGGALGPHFTMGKEASVVSVHYPKEKLLTQLFSIENNFSIYALS